MGEVNVIQSHLQALSRAKHQTANGRWAEASTHWEQVVANNPVEGAYWAELANACYEGKRYSRAIEAYEKAVELGAGFPSESAYRIACSFTCLGESERALEWLQTAFDMGYRYLERAQTDNDLAPLRDDQRYRKLVALIDRDEMSREQGWRYDIELLSREVKRKAKNPFRLVTEDEFDGAIRLLRESVHRLTDPQIIAEMRRLIAMLGDGHAGVFPTPDHYPTLHQAFPLWFYLFDEGLFIIATAGEYRDLLGARVLRFDDRSVHEVRQELEPLICRDNDQWLNEELPYMMREAPVLHALGCVANPHDVRLTVVDQNGTTQTVAVKTVPEHFELSWLFPCPPEWEFLPRSLSTPLPLYLKNLDANYWFEYIADDRLVYFQFNRVRDASDEPLAQFCERLFMFIENHAVEKLVLDMRWNRGGNTFLEMPLLHGLISSKVNQRGQLFVIIGRRTFSAAQNGASLIERHTEAIFVGEPTGSSPNFVGETIPIRLPYSRLVVNVSDLYWQSSWPMDYRTWIAPQIYTPPTFAAFVANQDLAMETINSFREHLPGW